MRNVVPTFKDPSRNAPQGTSSRIHKSLTGGKVNSGIGLSYRPVSYVGVRYDNPMQELSLAPSHGSMNSATERPQTITSLVIDR
jgi:hypothetical protein